MAAAGAGSSQALISSPGRSHKISSLYKCEFNLRSLVGTLELVGQHVFPEGFQLTWNLS